MLDFGHRVVAFAQACLAAATALFLLSLLAPGPGTSPGELEEFTLRFGITLYYVALAGTPFAMIVLLLLRLTGREGWAWTTAGGAAAGTLPMFFLAAILGDAPGMAGPEMMMAGVSGAAGGAVYHMIAPVRRSAP